MTTVDADTYQAWERLAHIALQVETANDRLARIERQLAFLVEELRGLRGDLRRK